MKRRKSRWPSRHSLALASMSLLLGSISPDADAVDRKTRDAHAGRVIFPADGDHDRYDSFIVYLRDDAEPGDDDSAKARAVRTRLDSALDRVEKSAGLKLRQERRLATGGYLLRLGGKSLDAVGADRLLLELAANPEFAAIEPNRRFHASVLPNDPLLPHQWALTETTGGINVESAWDSGVYGDGVVIAVIDTGQTSHPDLDGKTLPGIDMISDPNNGRDGNGRDADPSDMGDWNTANQCGSDAPARDSSWHGTHVAGIATAIAHNSQGVAGAAPNAWLQHVRVLGTCGGSTADIADGMVWASGGNVAGLPLNPTPAHVLNMSIQGTGECGTTYQTAVNMARANGSVLVVAAGNSTLPAQLVAPGNCNGVINVASSRRDGGRAGYSNFGGFIDLAAPGGNGDGVSANSILSTINASATSPGAADYARMDGTSMAAPYVAGVAALMVGASGGSLSHDQIETLLVDTARPFPIPCSLGCGTGIVDAAAAVAAAGGGNITQVPISVALYGFGDGTVTSSPAGINCGTQSGTTCSARFAKNASVTLQASPASGSVFAGWLGPCSTSSPTCAVSMQHAADVQAIFDVPVTPLSNGVQTGALATSGSTPLYFSIDIPDGATDLSISITGGSGDADLYVRHGGLPDINNWDCRPYTSGNEETCFTGSPPVGTSYIMLVGFPDFSGTRITASYSGGTGPWIFCNGMESGGAGCPSP